LGISPERIDVVGACCNEVFYSGDPGQRPEAAPDGPFLLYPASPLPAKNHEMLLEAFSRVARDLPDLRLVLVGPLTHNWERVRAAAVEHGVADRTDILGHVSLRELVWLYEKARALVFPSLFEGFGIPVLEAMALGCPVAASNATSVPEVAGDACILFDPTDTAQIAGAIEHAITMPEDERAAMRIRGKKQALRFRPEVMTRKLLSSMAAAVAERQG
jgi:glycosyltransferase involved in cell wall biosynthesis